MRLFSVVFLGLFLAFPARAEDADGWYGTLRLGQARARFNDLKTSSEQVGDTTYNYDKSYHDTVWTGAVAAGFSPAPNWRGEVEYAYRGQTVHNKKPTNDGFHHVNLDVTTHSLMLTGYRDFDTGGDWTPFVSAGAGLARHIADGPAYAAPGKAPDLTYQNRRESQTEAAWTLGGGTAYALSETLTAEFLYRYTDMGTVTWHNYRESTADRGTGNVDMATHEILIGLRKAF